MNANHQEKVDQFFDKLVETFGLNRGGMIHKALLKGEITQDIRRQVRVVCTVQ